MRTVQDLIDSLYQTPCHIFESECVAWVDEVAADADAQLRAFMDGDGNRGEVLNILSAISRACEHELDITVPAPVQEVQPDGSIRITTPMPTPLQLMPDRFSHLEQLFAEVRSA